MVNATKKSNELAFFERLNAFPASALKSASVDIRSSVIIILGSSSKVLCKAVYLIKRNHTRPIPTIQQTRLTMSI